MASLRTPWAPALPRKVAPGLPRGRRSESVGPRVEKSTCGPTIFCSSGERAGEVHDDTAEHPSPLLLASRTRSSSKENRCRNSESSEKQGRERQKRGFSCSKTGTLSSVETSQQQDHYFYKLCEPSFIFFSPLVSDGKDRCPFTGIAQMRDVTHI